MTSTSTLYEVSQPAISSEADAPFLPAASRDRGPLSAPAPVNNEYGFNSIQDFSGSLGNHNSDLHNTHADALGFHAYMAKFYTNNFWFKDGGVMSWQYEEGTDDYQGIYGVDAVCVFYHSGHGNMDANGIFQAPMGAAWNNQTWFFSNNNVKLADQNSRYIFWSTCLSCRVSGGMSPVKTWWSDDNDPGFRMLLGFETVSVDSPSYGSNFWNHWNKGESFSSAWINASWDIDHTQSASCVASGTASADSANLLNTERLFNRSPVPRDYYSWKWTIVAQAAARNRTIPRNLKIAEFSAETFSAEDLRKLNEALGLYVPAVYPSGGGRAASDGRRTVRLSAAGHLDVALAETNHANTHSLDQTHARRIADAQVLKHNLNAGQEYVFDMFRLTMNSGASTHDQQVIDPFVSETMVQYRQIINGVPTVNSDCGLIRVTIDNDGTVTRLHSSIRSVASLSQHPKSMVLNPGEPAVSPAAKGSQTIEAEFSNHLPAHASAALVEEQVGYDVSTTHGRIVVQRVYELTFEHGLKKRVKLMVSIFE